MNIHIDDDIKQFIDYIKKDYKESVSEFEIRITESGIYKLPKELFDKLFKLCKSKYEHGERIVSLVSIYKEKMDKLSTEYRKIKTIGGSTICQIKTKKDNLDRLYRTKNNKKILVRYSLSHENEIICPTDDDKYLVQKRLRQRYEFDTKKGYIYVFTLVKTNDIFTYEVEIEFDIPTLNSSLIEESLSFFKDELFTNNLSLSQIENVLNIANPLISKINPPKPVNIVDDDAISSKLKQYYYVTNKLDGQRYYLFFENNKVYSIQNKNVNLLSIKKVYMKVNRSIADVEFFEGKYYFFDCYLFKSKFIYEDDLKNRLENIDELVSTNPYLFIKKDFSNNLLDTTDHLLKTLDRSKNDGLIYTPYSIKMPVYKWKFPEKMSIDFRLVEKEKNVYDLCVYTEKDQAGYTPFSTYKSTEILEPNGIYEFTYQNKEFVLLRKRDDKEKPNFKSVTGKPNTVDSVWKDMKSPFEEYRLLNLFKPIRKMRRLHNLIKRNLISSYCKTKKVLDLGIGNGGDLSKYLNSNTSFIFGVEPYDKNYNELLKRITDEFKNKVKLIKKRAQDTKDIVEIVGVKGVDIVSSFFSLSFFFFKDRPEDLDQLVQTISQNLKEGGYFIGTTIDGEKTKAFLQKQDNQKFEFEGGYIKMNDDDTVVIQSIGNIVQTQTESLVDFKKLVEKLKDVGISLENSDFFPESENTLSKEEFFLNSLYRSFVFKKENITEKIDFLCNTDNMYDLITKSNDEKCLDIFRTILKEKKNSFDTYDFEPENIHHILKNFYLIKKYINPIKSINLLKTYTLFGDRLHKTLVMQKIPEKSVKLRDYKDKTDYISIREQLVDTVLKLKEKNINYGNLTLDGLLVNKDNTGLVRLIFYDYSKISDTSNTDDEQLIFLLNYLS